MVLYLSPSHLLTAPCSASTGARFIFHTTEQLSERSRYHHFILKKATCHKTQQVVWNSHVERVMSNRHMDLRHIPL